MIPFFRNDWVRLPNQDEVYRSGRVIGTSGPWVWVMWPDKTRPESFHCEELVHAELTR